MAVKLEATIELSAPRLIAACEVESATPPMMLKFCRIVDARLNERGACRCRAGRNVTCRLEAMAVKADRAARRSPPC